MTRTPPHNEEAEQALLGALLVNNKAYEKVGEFLRPEHFYDPAHQRIYAAVAEAVDAGRVASPITLRRTFDDDEDLRQEGGGAYLAELAANVVTVVNAADYGRTIHDLFLCRQLIEVGTGLADEAFRASLTTDPAGLIAQVEADLATLQDCGRTDGEQTVTVASAVDEAFAAIERAQSVPDGITGIRTGLADLDWKLGGLQPGDLIIIAGRPSMGKTMLATTAAVSAAEQGLPTLFNSLEMASVSLGQRLLASRTDISVEDQRRPLAARQLRALEDARVHFAHLPLRIDRATGLTAQQIKARAKAHQRRHGLALLAIDYLGLISPSDPRANKVHQVEAMTKALKETAKELAIPVLLLCQLSRQVEMREDKRPTLADLRDSGAIEQDADVVLLLYREEYYLSRSEPARRANEAQTTFNDRYAEWEQRLDASRNVADILIPKNRQGQTGSVRVRFDGRRQVFENLHRETEE